MGECVIECKHVNKYRKGVKVLNDVCFDVRIGEILVLLGEIGAGKSTLTEILYGVGTKDEGVVSILGSPMENFTPKIARKLGVSVISHTLDLCSNLNVVENVFLGWEAVKGRRYKGGMTAKNVEATKILQWLELDVHPLVSINMLSNYQKQLVEIAKAIATDAKVLIFDEPTFVLTARETKQLFGILRRLRDEKGIGIVYLCHRVDELLNTADRIALMKEGAITKIATYSDFTMEEFISFLGMQHFADSISETRYLARILTSVFSKRSSRKSRDEDMSAALYMLSDALKHYHSKMQVHELDEKRQLVSMRDFTDAFNVMIEQLSQRYQALMEAKSEAEAASKSKSAFLATMSHEIRTPLNAIIGLSEIQLQKQTSLETRQDLEKIRRSGSTLLGIINDILDISKIEAGSFELVPVEYFVPKLIDDVVQLNIVRIGSKNITFSLRLDETIPANLYGDELRVKQILNNLLSNAFKYTREGNVLLRVDWQRDGASAELAFSLSDTGVGIKKDDLMKLFSEYTQLDTRASRNIEGTGLGLSITKRLVDLMCGTIDVESEYGKGTTFTVKIPQQIVDDVPIGKSTAEQLEHFSFMEDGGGRNMSFVRSYMPYGKVLVVDDVLTNLEVAKGLMLPYGMTIDLAESGKEAIEKIHEETTYYDVVFMDHMMPEMDGIETTRFIRNEIGTEYARNVPIVALTANALAGNKEMFLANGFNDFLPKPIDITKLDVVLNQLIRDKQDEETLRLAEQTSLQMKTDESKQSFTRIKLKNRSVNGVDLDAGTKRYENETNYISILYSFVNHTPKLLLQLREIGEKNLVEYAITIHGIKGAALGICAYEAGNRAESLELAAKEGNIETVRADNGAFLEHMDTLIADLVVLLRQTEEADEKSVVNAPKKRLPEPSGELLRELLEATTHFRTSQMEKTMTALKMYEYETGGELINWLEEQMDNLDYDAMRERLSQYCKTE